MNKEKQNIVELIRLVDRNFKLGFRVFLFHSSLSIAFFSILLLLIYVELYLLVAPISEKVIISLTFAAVVLGFITLLHSTTEKTIVKYNYNRISKCVTDDFQKVLLKALIRMKVEGEDISLEEVYKRNSSLFAEEELLKTFYYRAG